MVSITQPHQQDSSPDDAPAPDSGQGGRHSAPPEEVHPHRFRRRRRWPVLVALGALAALIVPPPGQADSLLLAEVSDASLPLGLTSTRPSPISPPARRQGRSSWPASPRRPGASSRSPPPSSPDWPPTASRTSRSTRTASPPHGWPARSRPAASTGRCWPASAASRPTTPASAAPSSIPTARPPPRIMGPPLDGVQFAFIRDTDRGVWDGDSTYDRAVGPHAVHPRDLARLRHRRQRRRGERPVQHQRRRTRLRALPLRGRGQPAHRCRTAQGGPSLQPLRQLRQRGPRAGARLRLRDPGGRHPDRRQHDRRDPGTGLLRRLGLLRRPRRTWPGHRPHGHVTALRSDHRAVRPPTARHLPD